MGVYAEDVLPRLVNFTCGTGHNVPFYPDAVSSVVSSLGIAVA